MLKLAINTNGQRLMNNKITFLAITVSLALHGVVYYSWQQKKNSWLLAETALKTGTSSKGLIEHLNLVSKPTETTSKTPNKQVKPVQKQVAITKKIEKPITTIANKKMAVEQQKSQEIKASSNSSNAEASQQITQKAKVEYAPPPISYPPEAIAQNAKGKVKVKALIDIDGSIKNIEILVSSGYKILDEEAIAWFKKVKFSPALSANEKIASVVTQTITFDLNETGHNNS